MLNIAELEKIRANRTPLPPMKVVYFLFKGDEIVYIGCTKHFFRRLDEHTRKIEFDSYSILDMTQIPYWDRTKIEYSCIEESDPKHNIKGSPSKDTRKKKRWDAESFMKNNPPPLPKKEDSDDVFD